MKDQFRGKQAYDRAYKPKDETKPSLQKLAGISTN